MAKAAEKDDIAIHKRWFTIFHIAEIRSPFRLNYTGKRSHQGRILLLFYQRCHEETFLFLINIPTQADSNGREIVYHFFSGLRPGLCSD